MKKMITPILAAALICSMQLPVMAAEMTQIDKVKTIEVSMEEVMDTYAGKEASKTLAKDYAALFNQTGTITSIGQYLDFTNVLPSGSKVVSVTIYCPTSTKVTQSRFTSINSFLVSNGGKTASVKFLKTNSPSSQSTTTLLAGTPADTKWFVQIQGSVISNESGMDGFTVFGGSKMIIKYQ